jgi:regulator of sigma E protease
MLGVFHTVLAFVIAISILVVVHEFGHYWVAKRLGVKVLRFSVGFGKPIWSRRFGRDRTEWAVAAIPLGGYVKMLDEREGEVPQAEQTRAFNRQPVWKRVAIVVAGPAFNFLFAIVVYTMVFGAGVEGLRPIVGKVAAGSLAQQAGFRPGDEILSVDGRPVRSWDERRLYLYDRAIDHATVRFKVRDAEGATEERLLDLSSLTASEVGSGLLERQIGMSPALPEAEPVFDVVDEHGPAAKAGLHAGDRVLAIGGEAVKTWTDVATMVRSHPGDTLQFRIERGGKQLDFPVQINAVNPADSATA